MPMWRKCLFSAWCLAVLAAMLWARTYEPAAEPPQRDAFEQRHRICYDIYAASAMDHAYDLLAETFSGGELDRQYCFYAKAESQLSAAQASVIVWDLLYQDYRVVEAHGSHCRVISKWTVVFVLSHERHSHIRGNSYEAEFELRRSADGWKIVGSRILNENNLS